MRYSSEQKADAVVAYISAEGADYRIVSMRLGIAYATLHRWSHDDGVLNVVARRLAGSPEEVKGMIKRKTHGSIAKGRTEFRIAIK